MNPIFKQKIKGKVLFVHNELLYRYNFGKIVNDRSVNSNAAMALQLPANSFLEKLSYSCHLAARLLRNGVHHFIPLGNKDCAFIYNKRLQIIQSGEVLFDEPIPGSRPLSFEKIGNKLIFGEYRSNPERTPISIFSIDLKEKPSLFRAYSFEGIRHIHGIYQDPHTEAVYITTGDENNEAAIYKADESFQTMVKVMSGSQQTRAIKLLFDKNFIYFGSDAPHEKNYLYKINKQDKQLTQLTGMGSSVFHGCKVNNWLFFSTAIEPSKVNKTKVAEVWASPDGDNWKCILTFKKDIFPMRYFQYG
ncbi:MAG: hypothetical protein ACOCUL_02905, partial [Bacteroidota bacterium]